MMTVYSLYKEQVKKNPKAVAVKYNGRELSYDKLSSEADKIASLLISNGVKKGDIVGLCVNRSSEMVAALLGIIKCGAVYLPLDPFFPNTRLEYMLNDSESKFLITESLLYSKFSYYSGKFIDIGEIKQVKIKSEIPDNSDGNSLAYIIYTSGSTGNPKGVQILHSSLTNFLLSMQKIPGLNADDNLLALTTLSFDISGLEIFLPLITGAQITIASREEAKDGKILLNKIKKEKVTVVQATPSTWKMLIDAGWKEKLAIKALCGGEALPKDLSDKIVDRVDELWNMYGPTETTIWSSCSKVTKEEPIHIGKPIANTQFYIVDQDMNFCPPGVVGELLIGGDGLSIGYLKRDELTAEKFITNPFDKVEKSKVYKTGDLVRLNSKMQLEFLGRIDNQVKIRGYRIELEEIESVIKQNEYVKDCAAVVKEMNNDKKILTYVIPVENIKLNNQYKEKILINWLQEWDVLYKEAVNKSLPGNNEELDRSVASILTKDNILIGEAYDEWLNQTIERISFLKPRKVLEIGTGGGQLLKKIGLNCEYFAATDFSEQSIISFKKYLLENSDKYPPYKLYVLAADAVIPEKKKSFDTIVINSVIQYFPDIEYLLKVIRNALNYLSEGGCIYIGDVQCFSLLKNYHLNDQINHLNSNETVEYFKSIVKNRVEHEQELVVDPYFFYSLKTKFQEIKNVQITLRKGSLLNETTLYHYDVFIYNHTNPQKENNYLELDWNQQQHQLKEVSELILNKKYNSVLIKKIPNNRLTRNLYTEIAIESAKSDELMENLLKQMDYNLTGANLEKIWDSDVSEYMNMELLLPPDSDLTYIDALFFNKKLEINNFYLYNIEKSESKERICYNNPQQKYAREQLISDIKHMLVKQLPDYMVPSHIIFINEFPLTPNNKIDKKALAELNLSGAVINTSKAKAETEIQKVLIQVWEELLGFSGIGIDDNFFELGGHSILAAQMLADFEERTDKKIPLAAMFTSQTVRQLAETVENDKAKLNWSPLVVIKKGNNSLPPLFLIHGAEGNVLLYRDLVNRLNSDRTVYGIQARGLSREEHFHISIKEMAEDYLDLIKTLQPKGPYNIGGYCMGGTVAFEIGQRLSALGEPIQNIFLLETYNACLLEPAEIENNRMKEKIQNVKFHFDNIKSLKGKDRITFIQSKTQTALNRTYARISKITSSIFSQKEGEIPEHITLSLRDANDKANAEYRPDVFKGKIVLLRPKVSFSSEPDPKFGWEDFVEGELKVYIIDAAPRGMLTEPFVKQTAQLIGNEMN